VPDSEGNPVRVAGHPTWLEHPRTEISRFPLVIHAVGSADKGTLRFPTKTDLWASPQATVTLPLAQVGRLIDEIQRTAGGSPGEALTGRSPKSLGLTDRSSLRLGIRSDLAVIARRRVLADRRARFGTALPDGSTLTETDFSPALTSFVTLLVMYMLTSEIVDPRDAESETFAKGSLPLNVKTPLREIFEHALSDREKFVFRRLYGDSARRVNIFKLAKGGATSAAGDTRLFPPHTHERDVDRFHLFPPTWNTLIELTVTNTPLRVTKPNTVRKKNHSFGDEILFAPLTSMLRFGGADGTDPRIAIELRRIGFAPVGWRRWENLMQRTLRLAKKVNP